MTSNSPNSVSSRRKQPLQQAGEVSGKRWHGEWKFLVYQHCTRRRDADRARVEESVIRADKAAVPGDKTRLLGHVIVPDHVGVQSLLMKPFTLSRTTIWVFPGQ